MTGRGISAEVMLEAAKLHQTLLEASRHLSSLMRAGKGEEAFQQLRDYIDGLEALIRGLEAAGVDPEWLREESASLAEPLNRLCLAINHKDYIGVSDSLLYELIPRLNKWGEKFSGVPASAATGIRYH